MATKVNPRQLKINAIDTGLIKDGSITIDDINIAIANKSLITKIVAGSNVSISYTGADSGTGVVTVNANSNLNASILLSTLLSIDGSSSGIDADLLDGYHASFFAPLDSPSFIGIPVAPTATTGTNTTQIATTAFINSLLYEYNGSSNLEIAGALVASSLDIINDLTVNGSITTIKSTTLTTNDLIITIGGITNLISNDNKDRGIEFRWHNGTTNKLGFFGFDTSTGYLTFIPDATNTNDVISGTIGDIQATTFRGNLIGNVTGNITGNIDTATKLGTSRSISITGDISWIVNFDGSANVTASATLPNIATAGTYKSVTVNAKGQFTSGSNPTTLSGFGITDAQSLNANLTSLSALSTTGIVSYTGNNTLSARTISGTTNQISISNGNGVLDNPVISIANNPVIPGTSSLTIPIGTTAERPVTPNNGMLRYNSTLSMFEFYQVNSWINIDASTNLSLSGTIDSAIFINNDYCWVDLTGDVNPKISGNTSAVYRNFIGSINGWTHQASAEGDLQYHIPHDYAPNTNVFIHVHWGHNGTAISGNLNITFYATYAKRKYPAEAFITPITLTLNTESLNMTNSVRYCHRVDEIQLSIVGGSSSQFNTSNLEVDGLIDIHYIINTIPSISGSSISNLPYIFTIDVHMQSTGIGTGLKDPGYYL